MEDTAKALKREFPAKCLYALAFPKFSSHHETIPLNVIRKLQPVRHLFVGGGGGSLLIL